MFQPQDLKELLEHADDQTLTLYLTVDPAAQENQASSPAWHTWAKTALRELKAEQPGSEKVLDDIRSRVEDYLDDYAPTSKGLVMFYGQNFERAYELPMAVEDRATFGIPFLAPLLWLMDEYEPYLLVMVDNAEARFLRTQLGQLDFEDAIEVSIDTSEWRQKTPTAGNGAVGGGSQRDEFQDRLTEHMTRYYRLVAERVEQLMAQDHVRRVILAGNEKAAHAVKNYLTPKGAEAVVSIEAVPLYDSAEAIMQHVLPVALEYERQQEMALVEQVINMAKSGGRGSIGQEAVLNSLNNQQVELLIMPWPMTDEHLVRELPFRILASGGQIEFVHGEAAERLNAEGGLGARLYYVVTPV